jgi:hypothetical protein
MISSEESEAIIDIGWPKPQNFIVNRSSDNLNTIINIDWREIKNTDYPFAYDPSGVSGFKKIYYRVMINGKTFLSENSNISVPSYIGGETCIKLKAIYDIGYESPYYIQSEWTDEICVDNPVDPFCKKKCNHAVTTKTQNNMSRKKRYALAIKSARGAANFIC